jgi:predicted RNA-binding protein with PUA-like domain
MKSEPDVFSIDDLKKAKNQTSAWDGVRNYQARNFMMKDMQLGDKIFFYHSNAEEIGIAGIAEVAKLAYPDSTAWDKKSKYYDEKSTKEKPRWFMVDVKFVKKFKRIITLAELKTYPNLQEMRLLQKGNRLSINPVSKEQFEFILKLENK